MPPVYLKVYCFWYEGLEHPVRIEAFRRKEAKEILACTLDKLPEPYRYTKIINETIESLVSGVSTRVKNGIKYIWHRDKGGWVRAN